MPTSTIATLRNRITAGYAGLILVTHEENRATSVLQEVATSLDRPLLAWNCIQGRTGLNEAGVCHSNYNLEDPIPALQDLHSIPQNAILLLQDLNLYLDAAQPALIRQLKLALNYVRQYGAAIVLTMPILRLPTDLEKSFSVIDIDLPDRATLTTIAERLCFDRDQDPPARLIDFPTGDDLDTILDAAAGLTVNEAENAFALSLSLHGAFIPAVILQEKAATLRKNGLVEYIEPKLTLDNIGGWDAYKAHILGARHQFSKAAIEYARGGPMAMKGDLLVGQAGTGKSLIAKIIGSVLNIPVLRVRLDALKGSLVGQTEANWRSVYKTAQSLGKCVLHLDEPDGLMSAVSAGGGRSADGGTTETLIKAILQDIQESQGIYWVLTANDIDNLPGPLVDRLNVWSAELPNEVERVEIFQIMMRTNQRNATDVCPKGLQQIAKLSDGFSGRQIERIWLKAINLAFNDNAREPMEKDIIEALKGEIPTSKTMATEIERRRKRLEGIARPVTSPTLKTVLTANGPRKLQAAG